MRWLFQALTTWSGLFRGFHRRENDRRKRYLSKLKMFRNALFLRKRRTAHSLIDCLEIFWEIETLLFWEIVLTRKRFLEILAESSEKFSK